jgi:hypothetical protein
VTDVAYKNAMIRRDSVAAEINSLQQRLDELRREATRIDAWIHGWVEFAGGSAPVDAAQRNTPVDKPVKRQPNPPKEEIAEFTRQLIMKHNAPVNRGAIMVALEDFGVRLEGNKPEMVLSTMLWRMQDRVVRLRGHGYWLTEKDYDPAGYKGVESPFQSDSERDAANAQKHYPTMLREQFP